MTVKSFKPTSNTRLSLKPLEGIRVVSCLAVLAAHCIYWLSLEAEDKAALYSQYAAHPWMNLVLHIAEPAMDTFLVLTGFLAALSLLPALEKATTYREALWRYYQKRLVRIVPSYYSVLIMLHTLVLPQHKWTSTSAVIRRAFFNNMLPFDATVCAQRGWRNFLFMNNQDPNGGCYNVSWSLAVQMQFYALFPLALLLLRPQAAGFRRRVALAASATVAAVLVYRAVLLDRTRLWEHMPVSFFAPIPSHMQPVYLHLAKHSYLGFFARLAPLCIGVLSAVAVTDGGMRQNIRKHRVALGGAAVLLAALILGGCAQNKVGMAADPGHMLADSLVLGFSFTFVAGFLSPLLPALLLVLTTTGEWGALARGMSSRSLTWLADLSYDIYLLHPLVIFMVWSMLPPSMWFTPDKPQNFAAVASLVLCMSIAFAWVHNRFWAAALGKLETQPVGKAVKGETFDMHARAGLLTK